MWATTSSMWDVADSTHDVQALCGLSCLLCGLLIPYACCYSLHVGCCIPYVGCYRHSDGCCILYACCTFVTRAFVSSMWVVADSMSTLQALFRMLQPACTMNIFYVGCCSLHAYFAGAMWAVAASMWAIASEDRERMQGTKTRNEDRVRRQ